jgi:hypothetical protein
LWNTFVTIGSGGAFLELLAATVSDLLDAISNGLSATALDRIYPEIEPIDFSIDVLSPVRERLLVLRDGPSGLDGFRQPAKGDGCRSPH